MARHDYQCSQCGRQCLDLALPAGVTGYALQLLWPQCPKCLWPMDRLPSAPNFVVNGFNARNGYTKGKS